MEKFIKFEDIKCIDELTDLMDKLLAHFEEDNFREAFNLAQDNFIKFSAYNEFFIAYLTIIKELDFFSITAAPENMLKSLSGINPFGNDFIDQNLDNFDPISIFNELITNSEEIEYEFGYDQQLKDYTMHLNEQCEERAGDENFIDIDFNDIYSLVLSTYVVNENTEDIAAHMSELIARNFINISSDSHNHCLKIVKEAYELYSDNISIAFDFLSVLMFCSLLKTVPKNVIPSILIDAYKLYTKYEYENFADVYSCLLYNTLDDLQESEKSKAMFIIRDIMLDYEMNLDRYNIILKIIIDRRLSLSTKRNLKNILKDTKEIAISLSSISNDLGLTYLNAITFCIEKNLKSITLPWLKKEYDFFKKNLYVNEFDARKAFANAIAELVANQESDEEKFNLINILKDMLNEDLDCFTVHGFYALGLYNYNKALNITAEDAIELFNNCPYVRPDKDETYALFLAYASHNMDYQNKKNNLAEIRNIRKDNVYNEKIEYAELLAVKELLAIVDGDEFYAYLSEMDNKFKDNSDKISLGLEIEYINVARILSSTLRNGRS